MARKLFSFEDVDVYEKDASFFERGQWLNDVCINLGFKFIEQEKFTSSVREEILLFDPAVMTTL
jgi:Ulp1 family protease